MQAARPRQAARAAKASTNSRMAPASVCSIVRLASRTQSSIETERTASFTFGTALAFMLRQRRPSPNNSGVSFAFPAISPHTETGFRNRSPASAVN